VKLTLAARRQFDLTGLGGLLTAFAGVTLKGGSPSLNLGTGSGGFSSRVVKTEKFEPQIRKGARRERLWFGPYDIPGIDVGTLV
jgi:hypothetical protein